MNSYVNLVNYCMALKGVESVDFAYRVPCKGRGWGRDQMDITLRYKWWAWRSLRSSAVFWTRIQASALFPDSNIYVNRTPNDGQI